MVAYTPMRWLAAVLCVVALSGAAPAQQHPRESQARIAEERALKAAAELRAYGRVREADFTGLTLSAMSAETAAGLGLDEPRGLMVTDPGIAAAAGLRPEASSGR